MFFPQNQKWWNLSCWASSFDAAGNSFDDQTSSKLENVNGSLESVSFGTLFDTKITPETHDFFVSDANGDPDCPTKGYSSIDHAIINLKQGKVPTFITPNRFVLALCLYMMFKV